MHILIFFAYCWGRAQSYCNDSLSKLKNNIEEYSDCLNQKIDMIQHLKA